MPTDSGGYDGGGPHDERRISSVENFSLRGARVGSAILSMTMRAAASPIASYFQRMTVIGGVVNSAKSESPQPIMEISSGILSFSVETARRIPVSIEIPPATTAVGRFLLPSRPETAS